MYQIKFNDTLFSKSRKLSRNFLIHCLSSKMSFLAFLSCREFSNYLNTIKVGQERITKTT